MEVIRSQAVKKIYHQAMREMQKLESETHKRKVSLKEVKTKMKHNPAPIDLSSADQSPDNLISYKEFIDALKCRDAKDHLYYKILPRSLTLKKVLETV